MWIEACHVTAGRTSGTTAYKAYRSWCNDTGNKPKTMQNFVKDIAHMLPDAIDESGRAHLNFVSDEEEDQPIFAMSSKTKVVDDFDALGLGNVPDDEDVA
jgi:Poxvirus D5 protein-like.